MKVVIIGGGIAGLTMGRLLMLKNIDFVICERNIGAFLHGHAFLMHTDGLTILKELQNDSDIPIPGQSVDVFSLKRPEGKEIKRMQLNSWQCMKRTSLINFLYSLVPKEKIKEGRAFSHFIYEKDKIAAAVFLNGDVERGDIFIGADGSNSKVRELTHGKVKFSPVEVKEVVGVASNKALAETQKNLFQKFQKKEFGWSFGMIPTGGGEFVWFMQYDPSIDDVPDASPEELKEFCFRATASFPPVVHELLSSNDFNTTYPWNTRDFDLLPSFHRKNVVLIGDAAHVALPFTSAGTTNAILDAKAVMEFMEQYADTETAFKKYYEKRAEAVGTHISLGRDLKKLFLSPPKDEDNIPVPLIEIETNDETLKKTKPLQILYFTDPACSATDNVYPELRKLALEYNEFVNIDYRMGGLLPYAPGLGIEGDTKPGLQFWQQFCERQEQLPEGDIWVEDILESTFAPSVVFKAAQLQGAEQAIMLVRRIRQLVIAEKPDEITWDLIESVAFESGIDPSRMMKDLGGKAQVLFRKDAELAKKLKLSQYPALHFMDKEDNAETLSGLLSYDAIEDVLMMMLPDAEKVKVNPDPKFVFQRLHMTTTSEFSKLTGMDKSKAGEMLEELFSLGAIERFEDLTGTVWINASRQRR